mgnify:CR=1 FL=1
MMHAKAPVRSLCKYLPLDPVRSALLVKALELDDEDVAVEEAPPAPAKRMSRVRAAVADADVVDAEVVEPAGPSSPPGPAAQAAEPAKAPAPAVPEGVPETVQRIVAQIREEAQALAELGQEIKGVEKYLTTLTTEAAAGAALKRIRAKREAAEKARGASAPEPGSAG